MIIKLKHDDDFFYLLLVDDLKLNLLILLHAKKEKLKEIKHFISSYENKYNWRKSRVDLIDIEWRKIVLLFVWDLSLCEIRLNNNNQQEINLLIQFKQNNSTII